MVVQLLRVYYIYFKSRTYNCYTRRVLVCLPFHYELFFLIWNQVMMNGRENAKLAPPIITKNNRTLFLVWNGMFWKKDSMEK